MKKDNELDQLFKKGLEDPEIPFNDLDWIKMADRLDAAAPKKMRPIWLYTAAGIAAALLVVLFWILSDNNPATQNITNPNLKAKTKPSASKPPTSKPSEIEIEPRDSTAAPLAKSNEPNFSATNTRSSAYRKSSIALNPLSKKRNSTGNQNAPVLADVKIPQLLANGGSSTSNLTINLSTSYTNYDPSPAETAKEDIKAVIAKFNNETSGKLVLSILAAPDISNTKLSIGNKISSNFGLLLTYAINNKLSLTSGAIYARKLYDYGGTGPSLYGTAGAPWEVDADCYVIDVPLNLNYQVFRKKNISISVNSGLSSYFMLKEKYKYINVEADGTSKLTALEFNNQNKHILGVANFSVSFDHKIGRNLSIGVQPFYKVPLTGIGYYDSDLKSKGVAFSISISPFAKKK